MKKRPLALIAVIVLAGAGLFALHRTGEADRKKPLATPPASTGSAASQEAFAMPAPSHGAANAMPIRPDPASGAPLAFDYTDQPMLPDGSLPVKWNFEALSQLQPGDSMKVRLPFGAEPYTAIVLDDVSSNGMRRLSGRLQNDRDIDSWPFSMTLSSNGQYVTANFTNAAASFNVDGDQHGGRLKDTAGDEARLEHDAVHPR
jgi:hypothetical protein